MWTPAGNLITGRSGHTATLLPDGTVLVAAGAGSGSANILASAEIYNPTNNSWTSTGSLKAKRLMFTATLLPNGKVLVAGGFNDLISFPTPSLNTAELYDYTLKTWSSAGNLIKARQDHAAIALADGRVLVSGGNNLGNDVTTAEVYDPETAGTPAGTWLPTTNPGHPGSGQTMTLLTSGKVLTVGGQNGGGDVPVEQVFDRNLGAPAAAQPNLMTASISSGHVLLAGGTAFKGISEDSSGDGSSATNYPVVQLFTIDGGQTRWLPADTVAGWSNTSFTSQVLNTSANKPFPQGYVLVMVITNGIPSVSQIVLVGP
jgi:hypothetical protein